MMQRLWQRLRLILVKSAGQLAPPPPGLEQVTSDATRCVQCGLCTFNCPVGIDVRAYARLGDNVTDPRCITCGACVMICPRGTLRWGVPLLIREDGQLALDPDGLPGFIDKSLTNL